MTQLEYLIALISIIVGLSLADLFRSVRELVRPDRTVRWHWLPLLWATTVLLVILQLWWVSFRVLQDDIFARVLVFLPYLLMFLVLYLICSFALPDPDWESSDDAETPIVLSLKSFYFSTAHRRWFFGALIALLILSQVISNTLRMFTGEVSVNLVDQAQTAGFNLLVTALLGGLIASRRWWLHALVAVFFFCAVVYSLATQITPLG